MVQHNYQAADINNVDIILSHLRLTIVGVQAMYVIGDSGLNHQLLSYWAPGLPIHCVCMPDQHVCMSGTSTTESMISHVVEDCCGLTWINYHII
jgi:hypothetical protein